MWFGTTFRFYRIRALQVSAARVNMGGVGSSWEWEQKPGSFGLGCKPSSRPGSLGITLGSCTGLVCSDVAVQAAKPSCETYPVLKLHPKKVGTEKLGSMNHRDLDMLWKSLDNGASLTGKRSGSLRALLGLLKCWTESRKMNYRWEEGICGPGRLQVYFLSVADLL